VDTSIDERVAAMTAATGVVIHTEELTKVYPGDIRAVIDLNLDVNEGEIFGLLGPNGAGNTLDRSLSVWENLYYHGRYFGMGAKASRSVATDLLEVFRLADRAKANVATLSGGMAQRLMVARSIVHRPRILFLDEPTSGLDPQSRIALWEIIGQIHAEGQTVVLTTHYMEEADRLCERLAVMDHGRLLALDTPEALKRTVGGDLIVRVRAGSEPDRVAAHLRDLDVVTGATVVGETVLLTAVRSEGLLPRVIDAAEAGGFTVHDVSIDEPTLETVFINLTGKELRE
jgi:ABC-2 type transport system ATP-binding protein